MPTWVPFTGCLDSMIKLTFWGSLAILSEEEDFHKRTELAAELIRAFEPLPGRRVVLVDNTYCCRLVIEAVRERGLTP
jgi:hypothetical protein